jgi:hypothetical protein
MILKIRRSSQMFLVGITRLERVSAVLIIPGLGFAHYFHSVLHSISTAAKQLKLNRNDVRT